MRAFWLVHIILLSVSFASQAGAVCNAAYESRWNGITGAVETVLGQMSGDSDQKSIRCIELATGLRETSLPIVEATLGEVSLIAALVDQPAIQRRTFPLEGYWDRELAAVVNQEQDTGVDLSLSTAAFAKRLHLDCTAVVISPAGKRSVLMKGQRCFNAVPRGVAGQYEPTRMKLNFKHSGADDEEGRWTLVLTVRNTDSNEQAEIRLPYKFRIVYAE